MGHHFLCGLVLISFAASLAHGAMPEVKDLPSQKEMPDVMVMEDGTRVTTPEQWKQRREEMKEILEFYELGHCPPPPGNVKGNVLKSQPVLDGAGKYRLVHLSFGPEEKLGLDVAIFTPSGDGPFPTIINPSFFGTQRATACLAEQRAGPHTATRPWAAGVRWADDCRCRCSKFRGTTSPRLCDRDISLYAMRGGQSEFP